MTTDPQTPVEELEGRELDAAVAQEIFHIGHGPTPAHSWERLDPGDAQHLQSSYRCDRCGELSGWQWSRVERGYWPRRWRCTLTEHEWQVGETKEGWPARRCRYCRQGDITLPTVLTYPTRRDPTTEEGDRDG